MCSCYGRRFPRVERNIAGSEGGGADHTFDINTYTFCNSTSWKTSQKKVTYGMAFFKKFLDEYGALVRKSFDSNVHLWFVPLYSDEFEALEQKNGQYNKANYVGFNSRVMAKFPAGLFCKTQTA